MVGEGATETAFLKHLKNLYAGRGCGIAVKIEDAHGGSPATVVRTARGRLRQRAYEKCLVVMDKDKPWPVKLPDRVRGTQMVYAGCTPCIEGLLLTILQHAGFRAARATASQAKATFHAHVLDDKRKTDDRNYGAHFPKAMLESRRSGCRELDEILRFLEGK